jgi:hypothetical protein
MGATCEQLQVMTSLSLCHLSSISEKVFGPTIPNTVTSPYRQVHMSLITWVSKFKWYTHQEGVPAVSLYAVSVQPSPTAFLVSPTPSLFSSGSGPFSVIELMIPLWSMLIKWPPFVTDNSFHPLLIFYVCSLFLSLHFIFHKFFTMYVSKQRKTSESEKFIFLQIQDIPKNNCRASTQHLCKRNPRVGQTSFLDFSQMLNR